MKENNPIRIFVDAHVFDHEFQGSRTFIREIYNVLAQKKNIQLFLGAFDVVNLKKNFPQAANVFFVKYKSSSRFKRLLRDIPLAIKKYDIHFAHFQYIIPPGKKCKYIVTIHDVLFSEFPEEFPFLYRVIRRILFKRSAIRSDIVTTVSGYSKKSIQKYLGIKSDNIHIIPNGVNNIFFESYSKNGAIDAIKNKYGIERFILYVSRVEKRKNHIALLKAFLQLKLYQQGYYLVLLGHQSTRVNELDEILEQLPPEIKKFIIMNSKIDDAELLEFYRASTIFAYPSKAEGFGIPPLEAGALRIPVICSNASAMAEYSFFGENHIDPTNFDLFCERLNSLIKTPPGENDLNNIAELIHQRYSWTQSAENLYRLILSHKTVTLNSKNQTE
ncbi:MAG TPA: glycosyltransferase family 1 protein [Puia sp.]|nr:glycosyltransferase family 1 protein [Puia sp.]